MMGPGESVVIISSSMKKVYGAGTAGRYYYQNPNLKALLDAAIPEGSKPHQQKHRTGGCAEIGCLSVWEKPIQKESSISRRRRRKTMGILF